MDKKLIMGLLFICFAFSYSASIKTIPTADGLGIFKATIDTQNMEVVINCSSGARIEKLIDKKTG
ncbi:MAG: hypothetical protein NC922_08570, partial [Candidatus Omnitrophica bacterium]|nr:hypothetical protein [Candidatus Omnitrophota bacterium]